MSTNNGIMLKVVEPVPVLRKILDAAQDAHRKAVHDFAYGHLNINRLSQPPVTVDEVTQVHWNTSITKTRETINAESVKHDRKSTKEQVNEDKKTSNKNIGAHAELRHKREARKFNEGLTNSTKSIESQHSSRDVPQSQQGLGSTTRYKKVPTVTGEELKLPELMLPRIDSAQGVPPSLHVDRGVDRRLLEKHKFVTTYLAGVTSRDQYRKLLDFNEHVLKKSETSDRNVRDGHKAVQHLERKLVARLFEMQSKQPPGPSFERLQLYAEVWSDLTVDSSLFGAILLEIKDQYDSHLTRLLDSMRNTQYGELTRGMALIERGGPTLADSDNIRQQVERLEERTHDALLRNLELHEKIESERERIDEEKRMKKEEEEENMRRLLPVRRSTRKPSTQTPGERRKGRDDSSHVIGSTAHRLKVLRVKVWKKLDEISKQKRSLKSTFTPKQVHRNLQHAVKDVELEIMKLAHQSENLRVENEATKKMIMTNMHLIFSDKIAANMVLKILNDDENDEVDGDTSDQSDASLM